MKLPPLLGMLDQKDFFIYAACDHEYFTEFGPVLIKSIQQNTKFGVHLHLYNPTADQIKYCRDQERVSITYEAVPIELFNKSAEPWLTKPTDPELELKYKRIINAMSKGHDPSIQHRMQRTYFACARFIRLAQLVRPTSSFLAIDVDAIVRGPLPQLPNVYDFYMHHISGKKARFLAGGIYFTGTNNGYQFLTEYSNILKSNIEADNLYWGLDQDVLDPIVPCYRWAQLPSELIDWEMRDRGLIWTAKGTRKELDIFINEKKKYSS
jgi:hypothetical protein